MMAIPLRASARTCLTGNGICLGATIRRDGTSAISTDTRRMPKLTAALVAAIRREPSMPPSFFFSSIQLNKGKCGEHEDSHNLGASYGIARGNFTGGALIVGKIPFDISVNGLIFDGSVTHSTQLFEGERLVSIAFTHDQAPTLPAEDRAFLHSLGFSAIHDVWAKPPSPFF